MILHAITAILSGQVGISESGIDDAVQKLVARGLGSDWTFVFLILTIFVHSLVHFVFNGLFGSLKMEGSRVEGEKVIQ